MKPHITFLFVAAIAAGCGESETEVVSIPDPHVSVIGLDGEKRSIPSRELYDPDTGEPAVESVLVIDRESNRQIYLKIDQLSAESQANARYILVTEDPPASSPPAHEQR